MQKTIALEEHFAISATVQDAAPFFPPKYWPELKGRLLKATDRRLQEMDTHGVEMMVMSLSTPAVQAIPQPAKARELARRANDALAEEIAGHPERFRAFAALPMQDPEMAATELERCVRDLGFVGALVNGFSEREGVAGPVYYDLPQYRPFWKAMEKLGLPFYLHPRNPLEQDGRIYEGHPWLKGPVWAFGQETAVHALRLMASGLFDDCPQLSIILGHLGEGLPSSMWRVDHHNGWMKLHTYPARESFRYYFERNFFLTTSGNFNTQALLDALLVIGADHLLFSVDWPFEDVSDATEWFAGVQLSHEDKQKIGRENALKLMKIHP
ncbi:MAG TPA: amidohydrolase family protein [Ktedonobacteraceae bacterium]|nr:amidohydrolase family protein [Ktedonobacteraceae bacterium]